MQKEQIAINELELFDEIDLGSLSPYLTIETNESLKQNIYWLENHSITFYTYDVRQSISKKQMEKSAVAEWDEDGQMDIMVTFGTAYLNFNRNDLEDEWIKEKIRKRFTKEEKLENLFQTEVDGWTQLENEKMELYTIGCEQEKEWIKKNKEMTRELANAYIDYINERVEKNDAHVEIYYAPFRF